jgi:large subunit ribosomal protein L25
MTRLVNLKIEGDKQAKSVFVKEIQRNAVTRQLLHVDFYMVKKDVKMAVNVPIVLVGEAPALKMKGRLLSYGINELSLECLPEKVPPQIEVDISILEEVDQTIFVKDISLDSDITVHADPEQLVVKITEAALVVEEEVVAEEEEAAEAKVEEVVEERVPEKESEEKE